MTERCWACGTLPRESAPRGERLLVEFAKRGILPSPVESKADMQTWEAARTVVQTVEAGGRTMSAAARRACMSRRSFSRRLAPTGLHGREWLAVVRLLLTGDELRGPNGAKAVDVAHRLGWSDPFAMSNAYRRRGGLNTRKVRDMEWPELMDALVGNGARH